MGRIRQAVAATVAVSANWRERMAYTFRTKAPVQAQILLFLHFLRHVGLLLLRRRLGLRRRRGARGHGHLEVAGHRGHLHCALSRRRPPSLA